MTTRGDLARIALYDHYVNAGRSVDEADAILETIAAEHPAQRALDQVLALARQMQATSGQCFVFEAGDRIVRAIQDSRAIPEAFSEPVEGHVHQFHTMRICTACGYRP